MMGTTDVAEPDFPNPDTAMFDRRTQSQPETPSPDPADQGACGDDAAQQVLKLAAERDEARAAWQRAMADFQNYQRRAGLNEQEAQRQGVTRVLQSVFPVLDHFDLALTQATPDAASRRIMDGVKVIRDELIRALEKHGVAIINPVPNDEFDPNRHQAVVEQPAEGVEPGHISSVMQAGYALDGRVVRSAMVGVAPRAGSEEE